MPAKVLILILLSLLQSGIYAQQVTVTGKVTSEEEPSGIPGVSVVISGTVKGTITDIDGNYSLSGV